MSTTVSDVGDSGFRLSMGWIWQLGVQLSSDIGNELKTKSSELQGWT